MRGVETDRDQNRTFSKKKSRGAIDGVVTLCMAVGASEMEREEQPQYQIFVL